ncbi:MAG TPA: hypothetical protein VFA27_01805 [Vicinamibacterales bacterium]|nr:hypothetical protein [Vicinamibacterales bacterium]
MAVLIASVIIVGILAIAVVGGTTYFFYRHISARVTSEERANETFEQTRARFAGQQPLVEMSRGDEPTIHHPTGPPHDVQALHALAYNETSGKLTHVDVPGWLLRLMSGGGRIRIANMDAFGDEDTAKLTLEDLERHGPGLVIDVRRHHGSQLLVWTE